MRKSIVLTLAVTTCVIQLSTQPAAGKVAGTTGRIAFARYDPALGDTVTYTANPDGSHLRQLFPGASEAPHWSPDGSRVAILACADPPVCDTAAVIVDPDTGSYRVLTMPDPADLFTPCGVWSPDARRLACEGDGQTDSNLNGLYTINASDGGDLTRITSNRGGVDSPIDYSPDGQQIVFDRVDPTRPANANSALFVVHPDGGGLRRITPWGFSDGDGSWSPDGSEIAFEHLGSLFTVHPDGTALTKVPLAVTGGRFFAGDFVWSPDGTQLAFLLFSPNASEGIATAYSDGSHVHQLTTSATFDHQPDWGPHPTTT